MNDPRRRFNAGERAALYLAADGRCTECGAALASGWHGDHVAPHSRGGATDVINGQALCPKCNLKKGSHPLSQLRVWQERAMNAFYARNAQDFLVSATPGAGKTRFALALARRLLDEGTVARVAIVVPTDALRRQWADAAAAVGLAVMPVSDAADYTKAGYVGCVATYAQIARGAGSDLLRRATRKPTLAILDEIHHAGENKSWGDGLRNAVEHAVHRLALTGTPWRSEDNPIPFVTYEQVAGSTKPQVCVDYAYEYGEAVADGVCRRIEFHAYDGEAKWRDCGKIESARVGGELTDDDVSAALDAIYHPEHGWMPGILQQAVAALDEIALDIADAAGLVVAERQWHAHAYAKMLHKITGHAPVVVVSDDPEAKAAIDRFRTSRDRWIVSVRMVSEGVDIPRLAVGVYASKWRTPLFFRQVVGRFVRVRAGEEFNARLLIPAVPALMDHAREIELELRHQIDIERERAERSPEPREAGQESFDLREPISASDAVFDRAIFGGEDVSRLELEDAADWCRRYGIPASFAASVARGRREDAGVPAPVKAEPAPETPRYRQEKVLRGEVETLARKLARRAGIEPREVNTALLRAGFPARKVATVEQLEQMTAFLAERLGAL